MDSQEGIFQVQHFRKPGPVVIVDRAAALGGGNSLGIWMEPVPGFQRFRGDLFLIRSGNG
jgi:hypothetical protein